MGRDIGGDHVGHHHRRMGVGDPMNVEGGESGEIRGVEPRNPPSMTDQPSTQEARIAAVWKRTADDLAERVAELEAAAKECLTNYPTYEEMDPLRRVLGIPLYMDDLDGSRQAEALEGRSDD